MSGPVGPARERAATVRLLILDVDGVLTDGRLYYGDDGHEYKGFHTRDGHGIKMAQACGIEVAVISGRRAGSVERRLRELGIRRAVLGCDDKASALTGLLADTGVTAEQACYVGDDLVDLPAMTRVALAVAVADADAFVRSRADWVTDAAGGCGAVREVCEHLLDARGLLDDLRGGYVAPMQA